MTEQTLPDNEGGLLITEPGGVLFTSRGYCAFGDACANGYLAQMRFLWAHLPSAFGAMALAL